MESIRCGICGMELDVHVSEEGLPEEAVERLEQLRRRYRGKRHEALRGHRVECKGKAVEFDSVPEAESRLLALKGELADLDLQINDSSRMLGRTAFEYEGWRRSAKVRALHVKAEEKAVRLWLRRHSMPHLARSLRDMLRQEGTPACLEAMEALGRVLDERARAGLQASDAAEGPAAGP